MTLISGFRQKISENMNEKKQYKFIMFKTGYYTVKMGSLSGTPLKQAGITCFVEAG